jgi:hypothetical protein
MILKIAIVFGGGYLMFRLLKASLKHTLLDLLQPKEDNGSSELVQCTECQSFTDGGKAVYKRKMVFCSTECLEKHFSKEK